MRAYLAIALVALACAGHASADPVTVVFRNPHRFPIYLEATGHDGVVWPFANSTAYSICGSGCDCFALEPPIPRVRVLAAGEAITANWSGSYYELRSCRGEGPDCVCASVKQAAPGRHEAHVRGARSVVADGPEAAPESAQDGAYREWVSPDSHAQVCEARVGFELGSNAPTAPVAIECKPAQASADSR